MNEVSCSDARMKPITLTRRALMATACSSMFSLPVLGRIAPKRILVLGGTGFVGPAVVEAAIAEGHTVTLFNRGVTNPTLFPHVEKLRGFRSSDTDDQDLSSLSRRRFDAVIDVWPSDPAVAESAAQLLKPRTQHYLYISSIATYDSQEFDKGAVDETAPLESWSGSGRKYSRGKAESERRLRGLFGDRLTVVRPGPIKGDRDTTPDLLTWLVRAQSGGRHIGPGDGSDQLEIVDVKDIARFLMLAIDTSLFGTFNLTGRPMDFKAFLGACNTATRSDAEFVWLPQEFLQGQGLETDHALGIFSGNFPLWRPKGAQPGLFHVSSERAFRAGWRTRPFQETALDCLQYFRSQDETLDWTDYLSAAKEKAVLDAWESRRR